MIDQKKILAENLKAFRLAHNICQTEFAEECGISKDTLSLLERGKLNTTIDTLDLLAVRMDTNISSLLTHKNDEYYIVISKEITVEDITRITYGIGVVKDDVLIREVHDISLDYYKIKDTVYYCNNLDFHLSELDEIVEDIID